jgi:TRAP-type C4-dicarboxylate transport system permease small subunit
VEDDTCQLEPEGDNLKTDRVCIHKLVRFGVCGICICFVIWKGFEFCSMMWESSDTQIHYATPYLGLVVLFTVFVLFLVMIRNE